MKLSSFNVGEYAIDSDGEIVKIIKKSGRGNDCRINETFGEGETTKPNWHMNQKEFNEACDIIFGHKKDEGTLNEQSKSLP